MSPRALPLILVLPIALSGPVAFAQEMVPASASDQADLARLDGLIKHFASESRDYRTWAGVSALAIGAATIPAGVVMLNHQRGSDSPAGAVALGLGIGEVLGGGLVLAVPLGPLNQFQNLSDFLETQRARGKAPGEIVLSVETEWRDKAESLQSLRHTVGILGVSIGGLAVAGGTYLALADVTNAHFSRDQQYGFSAAFLGLGYLGVLTGFQAFFFEAPIEAAWKTYESVRGPHTPAPVSTLKLNGIGYSPVPGGGVVGLGATF